MQLVIESVEILKGPQTQFIIGQGTFNLLTVEEIFRAVATSAPACRFGVAFCEASDGRLLRVSGNDRELEALAAKNAMNIGAGHMFIVMLEDTFPLQILPALKLIPTVLNIVGATGNPSSAIVCRLADQSALLGIADGFGPAAVETSQERGQRRRIVRSLGYLEGD